MTHDDISLSHRAVVNYMRNDLGITPEMIRGWIESAIERKVERVMAANEGWFEKFAESAFNKLLASENKSTWSGGYQSFRERITSLAAAEAKKVMGQLLSNELKIEFKVTPAQPPAETVTAG